MAFVDGVYSDLGMEFRGLGLFLCGLGVLDGDMIMILLVDLGLIYFLMFLIFCLLVNLLWFKWLLLNLNLCRNNKNFVFLQNYIQCFQSLFRSIAITSHRPR